MRMRGPQGCSFVGLFVGGCLFVCLFVWLVGWLVGWLIFHGGFPVSR